MTDSATATTIATAADIILEARGIDKFAYDESGRAIRGSTVQLLHGASISLYAGEIHALIGENGAGKSTFIKVLGGAIPPEAGTVSIAGTRVQTGMARAQGISVIWQEFSLSPKLTVLENMFLGEELTRRGILDRREMRRRAQQALARLGLVLDLDQSVASLSTSQQQIVEIAKALDRDARVLILDEPTASLTKVEAQNLFTLLHALRARALGIILVTHRFDEVFAMSDRVTIMKDGRTIETVPTNQTTRDALISKMVGRELGSWFVVPKAVPGEIVLELAGVRLARASHEIKLSVRAGEIVTLAGLVGAGRTALCRVIVGADKARAGNIRFNGNDVTAWSLRARLDAGMSFVPEDRKSQGVILPLCVRQNLTMRAWNYLKTGGLLSPRKESALADKLVADLAISVKDPRQLVSTLSGGNQQRVAIGKWLARPGTLYVLDEPTRGVDVGARRGLYALIAGLVESGAAVLMVSSDLPEVIGMSNRIYVMREGAICAEYDRTTASESSLLGSMLPAHERVG